MLFSSVHDCQLMTLPKITNASGNLTAINGLIDIPFEIKRVYYLYDVPGGESRGGHAHRTLNQLVVAAGGSFHVHLDDGTNKSVIKLNRPYFGLLLLPGIWRELSNFSSGSTCLVLASEKYNEMDYIRNYEEFLLLKKQG